MFQKARAGQDRLVTTKASWWTKWCSHATARSKREDSSRTSPLGQTQTSTRRISEAAKWRAVGQALRSLASDHKQMTRRRRECCDNSDYNNKTHSTLAERSIWKEMRAAYLSRVAAAWEILECHARSLEWTLSFYEASHHSSTSKC